MPFSVFGLKSRLEAVEASLNDLQSEIRAMGLRLPEPGRRPIAEEEAFGRARAPAVPPVAAGPILPSAWTPDGTPRRPIGAGVQPPVRQEPSLGRPRAEPRFR
jgi:hypothetical protein